MDSIQLTHRAVLVLSQEPFSSTDFRVLARLMELASDTGLVQRSRTELGQDLDLLTQTISRSIVRFERAGLLERVSGPGKDLEVRFRESAIAC